MAALEYLVLPSHLDGSKHAAQRGPNTRYLVANDDLEAIAAWLDTYSATPNTKRTYRIAVERCLLWSVLVLKKPISSLERDDAYQFSEFLVDPRPEKQWINPTTVARSDPLWRPFRGPASARTRDQSVTILQILFDWLVARGYLDVNPWRGIVYARHGPRRTQGAPATSHERRAGIVTLSEWRCLERALSELRETTVSWRLRAVFYMCYYADLKPGEVSRATTADIELVGQSDMDQFWKMRIPTRHPPRDLVYILPPVQQAIETYHRSIGETVEVQHSSCKPRALIQSAGTRESGSGVQGMMAVESLYRLAKPVFESGARLAMESGDNTAARRLRNASLTWLNHAFETHFSHKEVTGNWPWLLLGTRWLAAPYMSVFSPDRSALSDQDAVELLNRIVTK